MRVRSGARRFQGTDSSAGQTNADSSAGGGANVGWCRKTEKGVYVRRLERERRLTCGDKKV
ncbi:MAG: hypothetical protein ACLRK9_13200 [Roseburia hominis]